MHPKEFKQEKAGTGRLTALSLVDSSIEMGIGFDAHAAVNKLIDALEDHDDVKEVYSNAEFPDEGAKTGG